MLLQDGALKGVLQLVWSFISPSNTAYRNVYELERIPGAYMGLDEEETPSLSERLVRRLTRRNRTIR